MNGGINFSFLMFEYFGKLTKIILTGSCFELVTLSICLFSGSYGQVQYFDVKSQIFYNLSLVVFRSSQDITDVLLKY